MKTSDTALSLFLSAVAIALFLIVLSSCQKKQDFVGGSIPKDQIEYGKLSEDEWVKSRLVSYLETGNEIALFVFTNRRGTMQQSYISNAITIPNNELESGILYSEQQCSSMLHAIYIYDNKIEGKQRDITTAKAAKKQRDYLTRFIVQAKRDLTIAYSFRRVKQLYRAEMENDQKLLGAFDGP